MHMPRDITKAAEARSNLEDHPVASDGLYTLICVSIWGGRDSQAVATSLLDRGTTNYLERCCSMGAL